MRIQGGAFSYEFTFDPADYDGFPDTYALSRMGAEADKGEREQRIGRATLKGELRPGEIVCWAMERE